MGKGWYRDVFVRAKKGDTSEEKWGDGANTKFSNVRGGGGSAALCPAHGCSVSGAQGQDSQTTDLKKGKYYSVSSILCYNLHVLGRELLELGQSHSSDPRLS